MLPDDQEGIDAPLPAASAVQYMQFGHCLLEVKAMPGQRAGIIRGVDPVQSVRAVDAAIVGDLAATQRAVAIVEDDWPG